MPIFGNIKKEITKVISFSLCCIVFLQLGQQPLANRLGQMMCIPVTTSALKSVISVTDIISDR